MATKKKALQAAAGAAGAGEATYVDDVFSTYLYTGNGSTQTITNGIDLDGEGGMVWQKYREAAGISARDHHHVFDTERGAGYFVETSSTAAQDIGANTITSFNADGFSIGNDPDVNESGTDSVAWTFRKAPGFFDVVTYTGNSTNRTISHNLGCEPGCIIIKSYSGTSSTQNWIVYHKGVAADPETDALFLNDTSAAVDVATYWNDTAPTSTEFSLGNANAVNASSTEFVAYLFADGDDAAAQIFGTDGDQAVVKCGSYTGNGSTDGPEIDLGFEPQWVLIKAADDAEGWLLLDNMRGYVVGGYNQRLFANLSSTEGNSSSGEPTATGFKIDSTGWDVNHSGNTYIYIAIRRPHKPASEFDATDLFAIDTGDSSGAPEFSSGFPVDMSWMKISGVLSWIGSRLTSGQYSLTNANAAEVAASEMAYDYQDGWYNGSENSSATSWMFRRAPGFFDVVAYTGTGSLTSVNHNLGVTPEWIWVKNRSQNDQSRVVGSILGGTNSRDYYMEGSTSDALKTTTSYRAANDTDTTFGVATNSANFDISGENYLAYLFASVPGICDIGTYTGNGSSQTIDCGFSAGARFVMIKRTDSTSNWNMFDTERGIVAGNDSRYEYNSTDAVDTSADNIDPDSSGFAVNYVATDDDDVNVSGGTYIYLAIA